MSDIMHEGDMAYELAEWDYMHLPVIQLLEEYSDYQSGDDIQEYMDVAWNNLLEEWKHKDLHTIRQSYGDMVGARADEEERNS